MSSWKYLIAFAETWIQYIEKVQQDIIDLNLEEVWKYCDDDAVFYGPLETDVFRGKETMFKLWTDNNEFQHKFVWEKPYWDGDVGVRRGHLGDWYFECRVKTKNNKVIELY